MKRTISIIAMLLLLVGMVSAGSISDLEYKDKYWFRDDTRTIDDNDVDIDADTVH